MQELYETFSCSWGNHFFHSQWCSSRPIFTFYQNICFIISIHHTFLLSLRHQVADSCWKLRYRRISLDCRTNYLMPSTPILASNLQVCSCEVVTKIFWEEFGFSAIGCCDCFCIRHFVRIISMCKIDPRILYLIWNIRFHSNLWSQRVEGRGVVWYNRLVGRDQGLEADWYFWWSLPPSFLNFWSW